jgi:isocitrate dehydrogenase kinase/phosphatase
VDPVRPIELIGFLRSIMPLKPVAELYIALGHVKHGKTELYRDLRRHLAAHPDEQFEPARGTRGMVMAVFTLPSYDFVFKLIKDRFDPPKQSTRPEVEAQYRFVRLNDRVGRLADVQEFEHLAFDRSRFSDELLDYLRTAARSIVRERDDAISIEHLYTERRVTPLNVFLQEASEADAREAVHELGQAIRDMAAAGLFPGDMLVKNFGVTRHGRVIFYDYDELGQLGDYSFRALPQARSEDEAMAAEPWYYVGPNDIFPEEIGTFLGLPARYREVFLRHHGELLTVEWWTSMQAWHDADEPPDLFPYHLDQRFPVDA